MTYTSECCDDGSGNTVGTLVRFDNVTILIDPGWHSSKVSFEGSVQYWSKVIPEVDIILISQPSAECLGAYALLYYSFLSHFVSRIEVYATLPITNLGRVTTIDCYVSCGLIGPFKSNIIELDDVEKAFDHIQALKYSQLADLRSKYDGLSLIAYSAGVNPGGCVWCISTYFEKLVYAFRWNHTRNTILNGSSLLDKSGKPLSTLVRPSAIITKLDRFGSSKPHGKRVRIFKDSVKRVLSSNGTAVIPTEIGGNFLDLFVLVHDFLYESSKSRLYTQVPVLLVSYSRGRVLTYARSMLEWLSASLLKIWEARDNKSPFDLGNRLHVVTPAEISKFTGSKICFVSQVETLVDEVLMKLCQMERTTVLLTSVDNGDVRTISTLHRSWESAQKQQAVEEGKTIAYLESLTLRSIQRKPLMGDELDEYTDGISKRRSERAKLESSIQRDAHIKMKSLGKIPHNLIGNEDATNPNSMEDVERNSDDEDDDGDDDNLLGILKDKNQVSVGQAAIEIPVDYIVQPGSHAKHQMFPFQPERVKIDDYGTLVNFNSLLPSEDEETDHKKGSSAEQMEEDEDPYELSDTRRETSKRTRRVTKKGNNNANAESIDNVDYLNPLKSPADLIETTSKITVKCALTFINLESLVDQRSASVILPALKPRNIVLLGPKETQNTNSVNTLQKRDVEIVEMPLNKPIEFTTTIKSLDISIDPELDSLLKWQKIGDCYTVARVIGRLVKEKSQSAKSHVAKPQSKQGQTARTKLVLKPLQSSFKVHTSGSLSIGDIRLAELKRRLTEKRYRAEFKGEGTLVVNGQVAVRKISDSETVVDGSPSELFYNVKKSITDMLAKI